MHSWGLYLSIAAGGATGACLRYFIAHSVTNLLGKGFPFGTLAVNIIGSFGLGLLYAYIQHDNHESLLKAFIGIGLLGAFTTFSTFSFDTLLLIQQGELVRAFLNVLVNLVVCILCVWLALLIFKG